MHVQLKFLSAISASMHSVHRSVAPYIMKVYHVFGVVYITEIYTHVDTSLLMFTNVSFPVFLSLMFITFTVYSYLPMLTLVYQPMYPCLPLELFTITFYPYYYIYILSSGVTHVAISIMWYIRRSCLPCLPGCRNWSYIFGLISCHKWSHVEVYHYAVKVQEHLTEHLTE